MSKVVDFLNEAQTYYIATVEDDQPRVRPFGATMEYNTKVYLGTQNDKNVFKQLVKNPKIEISGMANGKWIRITGNAVVDEATDAKEAMLNANPFLKKMHSADDGRFVVFYIDEMKAVVYSFEGEPLELED
jgi:uncharacterized pyridoxamine 5'-phosphate oxidase family protein